MCMSQLGLLLESRSTKLLRLCKQLKSISGKECIPPDFIKLLCKVDFLAYVLFMTALYSYPIPQQLSSVQWSQQGAGSTRLWVDILSSLLLQLHPGALEKAFQTPLPHVYEKAPSQPDLLAPKGDERKSSSSIDLANCISTLWKSMIF